MNYSRIYAAFIASRRANPPASKEYVEVHHIVPRCMGGGDEPGNLIRLRPDDHFFAHLLLAKAYRTADLWAACVVMADFYNANGRIACVLRARRAYGMARRSWAALAVGEAAPRADRRPHNFYHYDGRAFTGTRIAFSAFSGVLSNEVNLLISGRREMLRGWATSPISAEERRKTKLSRLSEAGKKLRGFMRNPEKHHFYHTPTGVSVLATQKAMRCLGYLTAKKVSALVCGRALASGGWCLAENAERDDLRIVRTRWQGKVPWFGTEKAAHST
jgi:hypothetical protein